MAWSQLTTDEVLEEFNPSELNAINAIKGRDALAGILDRIIAQFRGAILAGNYPLGPDGTMPEGLKAYAIAMVRWKFLVSVAKNDSLQTRQRENENNKAVEVLQKISNMDYAVEDPVLDSNRSGNWNSENKLTMRTHPVPRPSVQGGNVSGTPYANPNGPADS